MSSTGHENSWRTRFDTHENPYVCRSRRQGVFPPVRLAACTALGRASAGMGRAPPGLAQSPAVRTLSLAQSESGRRPTHPLSGQAPRSPMSAGKKSPVLNCCRRPAASPAAQTRRIIEFLRDAASRAIPRPIAEPSSRRIVCAAATDPAAVNLAVRPCRVRLPNPPLASLLCRQTLGGAHAIILNRLGEPDTARQRPAA